MSGDSVSAKLVLAEDYYLKIELCRKPDGSVEIEIAATDEFTDEFVSVIKQLSPEQLAALRAWL